jgi:hypothetical protein
MHRESEKHSPVRHDSPRTDADSLISGGAKRAEGPERTAPSGRGSPAERPAPPRGMSPADVARRAELTRHLPPSDFPADRGRLLAHLRSRKVPDSVVDAVSRLPEGQEFHSVGEVVRAAGLRSER